MVGRPEREARSRYRIREHRSHHGESKKPGQVASIRADIGEGTGGADEFVRRNRRNDETDEQLS